MAGPDFVVVSRCADVVQRRRTLLAAEALHRTLRPNLAGNYVGYMERMFAEGAEMVVLMAADEARALAVFRSFHTTFHGHRFYIDDLVTADARRGEGIGRMMLSWCEERARQLGCDTLDLDSGVQRTRAHGFYFRERLGIFAFGFTKPLQSSQKGQSASGVRLAS